MPHPRFTPMTGRGRSSSRGYSRLTFPLEAPARGDVQYSIVGKLYAGMMIAIGVRGLPIDMMFSGLKDHRHVA